MNIDVQPSVVDRLNKARKDYSARSCKSLPLNIEIESKTHTESETSNIQDCDACTDTNTTDRSKMRKRLRIPERFKHNLSATSLDSFSDQNSNSKVSGKSQKPQTKKVLNENAETTQDKLKNDKGSDKCEISKRDSQHSLCRSNSYKEAVDNTSDVGVEDRETQGIPRPRSNSFKSALEEGQITPSSLSSMTSASSLEDETPDIETSGGSLNSVPKPRYSSTPLVNTAVPENVIRNKHKEMDREDGEPSNRNSKSDSDIGIERELFKQDAINFNR